MDLERGVKSKNCDNPGSKNRRKKARKLLDDTTGKIHRIKRKEKRAQKRAHQFFRKKHKTCGTNDRQPTKQARLFYSETLLIFDFLFGVVRGYTIKKKEGKGEENFAKQFRGTFLGRIYKENFHNWVKFGQFFWVLLLFVVQSKALLVDEKWHLTRGFIILD